MLLGIDHLVIAVGIDPATSSFELLGIDWTIVTTAGAAPAGAALAPSATLR
jgi:hypothetical protein